MADVLKPIIGANDFKEGSVIVSVDKVGNTAKHRIDPAINYIDGILSVSGILQDRFDDTGVYGGSTKT